MLEEFMSWHVTLLQSIVDHNNHPNMINAHRQSALKEERATANQTSRRGYAKEEQTNNKKRDYEAMNENELLAVQDFYTGRAKNHYANKWNAKMPRFVGRAW